MKFKYQARTKKGELKIGTIEASSREVALELLQKLGLYVTYLKEEKPPFYARKIEIFEKITQKDVALFTRQLSILINAGVPLSEALLTIASQVKKRSFKEKITKIVEAIEGGSSFSKALSLYPQIFSPFYVNLVKSGEMTGKLSLCLNHLADHLETSYNFRQKIIGALLYPIMVLLVFLGVASYLTFVILPSFEEMFAEREAQLPFLTSLVLSSARFIRQNFFFIFVFFLFFFLLLFWFLSQREGRETFDKFLLKTPFLGTFFQKVYLSRIAQTLSTLIAGGIQLVNGLDLVSEVVGNISYKKALKETKEKVKEGVPLSRSLGFYQELFTPLFLQMIAIGEKTGKLEFVLTNLAKFQQNEIERTLENLSQILEPLLIVILGGLVGILIASVIIPLYRIVSFY